MVVINMVEKIAPKQMTVPIGLQRGLLLMIIGITPIEAAAEVRNMGRILRFPASMAADLTVIFSFILNFSA